MVTAIALAVVQYCTLIVMVALCARVLGRRYLCVRQVSTRVAVLFGVFLAASVYIWLELGPELDQGYARLGQPLAIPAPRHFDI